MCLPKPEKEFQGKNASFIHLPAFDGVQIDRRDVVPVFGIKLGPEPCPVDSPGLIVQESERDSSLQVARCGQRLQCRGILDRFCTQAPYGTADSRGLP